MSQKKKKKIDRFIDSLESIDNKLVIITGSNSGIGFEIARIALLKGARVVMACRNLDRANAAKEKLINLTNSDKITIEQYDQSNISSVKNFAKSILNKYSDFYALVLNAGIFPRTTEVDEYHVSLTYKTNFLGECYLLKELEDYLSKTKEEKRIIIQGSVASFVYKYKNSNRFLYGEENARKSYSLSKLCCSNLYVHLKDNSKNKSVKYLLCEPGASSTNLFNGYHKWFKFIVQSWLRLFANTVEMSSLTACQLLTEPANNGDYYRPKGFASLKGLPKKIIYPEKWVFPAIIEDAKEVMKNYE